MANSLPPRPKRRAEVFFNRMKAFYNAMVIYVLAGLLAIFSWFNLSETLRRSVVWLIGLAFVIHTTGLIYRMIRERGLVVCAIGGNIVTSWSWFGVNMLGIGLHSCGFTDAAFKWMMLFVAGQIGFILLGLLPPKLWKSSLVQN